MSILANCYTNCGSWPKKTPVSPLTDWKNDLVKPITDKFVIYQYLGTADSIQEVVIDFKTWFNKPDYCDDYT